MEKIRQCTHVADFKQSQNGLQIFAAAQRYVQSLSGPTGSKLKPPKCSSCSTLSSRLHLCLHCVFTGCWMGEGHMRIHAAQSGHYLCLCIEHNVVYCSHCADYIYDDELDRIAEDEAASRTRSMRVPYRAWQPTDSELSFIKQESNKPSLDNAFLGLRGLQNLGSTCFMNSILQCLAHNPLLRNYFLGDGHIRTGCEFTLQGQWCMACEMDRLLSKFSSGEKQPITPHRFLHCMWTQLASLADYQQQDAHEFYINLCDGLHNQCGGTQSNQEFCRCIIHRLFGGIIRSDVTCGSCHYVSSTFEPFLDVPLSLPRESDDVVSLVDCLYRNTRPERLEGSDRIICSNCQQYGESSKQLSYQSLPNVICFHLKRFHYSKFRNTVPSKMNALVDFPITGLDMSPFSASRSRFGGSSHQFSNGSTGKEVLYDLCSVVNHHGDMDNGHYTSFVLHGQRWFRCDDTMVTDVDAESVLTSNAYVSFAHQNVFYARYLLFYIKRGVEYSND